MGTCRNACPYFFEKKIAVSVNLFDLPSHIDVNIRCYFTNKTRHNFIEISDQ